MRDPHCLKCGKYIARFAKGWKYSVVKRHGGYYHESCWEQHINRPKKIVSPEIRSMQNKRYYEKHKTQLKSKMKQRYYTIRESHIAKTRQWALDNIERSRELKRNWMRKKRLEIQK